MNTTNGSPEWDAPPPANAIPASLESEAALLGSCLINPEAIHEAAVLVRPADFFRERNGWIFEAMLALNERREPIDYVLLTEELERKGRLAEIGPAYLTGLIAAVPSGLYAVHYAKVVAETALRRRLIAAAGEIARIAYNEAEPADRLLDDSQEMLFAVGSDASGKTLDHIEGLTQDTVNHVGLLQEGDQPAGLPTGFVALDRTLGGFGRGDLIILAARPSVGKTAMALTLAYNAARLVNARVGFFSLEMSDRQITQRWLSMISGIDSTTLRLGKVDEHAWPVLLDAANNLSRRSIYVDDTPALTVTDVRTRARRVWAREGLDLIVVDYLQLMRSTERGENNHLEVSAMTKGLKALARELNIPIIALSQLSRGVEQRSDKRPMLSDLRASGAIEEDADVVMFLYRDDYYHPETEAQNIAEVIIAKHRNGATGTACLFFRKELAIFRDLEITRTDLNNY
jgi:replicative DNA helicase